MSVKNETIIAITLDPTYLAGRTVAFTKDTTGETRYAEIAKVETWKTVTRKGLNQGRPRLLVTFREDRCGVTNGCRSLYVDALTHVG